MEKQTTASVYLGGPFYTPAQKQRVQKAQEYLRQNPTVGRVHFPFDHQYTNPADPSDASSLKWQLATYQNDLQGMINTDAPSSYMTWIKSMTVVLLKSVFCGPCTNRPL